MPESLLQQLQRVHSRLRQLLWVYGLSCVILAAFGLLLAACLLDWLLRLDDSGVRLILILGVAAATAGVTWRFLVAPLRQRMTPVDLARRMERRFPELRDQLATTVAFMEGEGDPRLGSPSLQRRQVASTLKAVEQLDLTDLFQLRAVQRAGLAAIALLLIGSGLAMANRPEAATALSRLLLPFSDTRWPRRTELEILDGELQPVDPRALQPLRIASGHSQMLYAGNRKGGIPADTRVEFEQPDGSVVVQPLQRTSRRHASGEVRSVCGLQLTPLDRPLRFRLAGGDDVTPWYEALAVPPPRLEGLRLTLQPPPYSGLPARQLPEGAGHIQALVGTEIRLEARSSRPLQSARLRLRDDPAESIVLSADAREISARFVLARPGLYAWWLELTDSDGFEDADAPRFEVRAIADTIPEVRIEEPQTDLNVTPEAVVPVTVEATDDLALREVLLRYRTGDRGSLLSDPAGHAEREVMLFDAALAAGTVEPEVSAGEGTTGTSQGAGRRQTLQHTWDLAQLNLQPGMQLGFYAAATDAFDLGEPHTGRSVARLLTVVAPEDKVRELLAGQAALLDDLEQILKSQRQARESVQSLLTQIRQTGDLRTEDRDLLKQVEVDQRAVSSRLTTPAGGVHSRVQRLLRELQRNRLEQPDLESRLRQIEGELRQLGDQRLPSISADLTTARKLVETRARRSGEDSSTTPERGGTAQPSTSTTAEQPKPATSPADRAARQTPASPPDSPDRTPAGDAPAADIPADDDSPSAPGSPANERQPQPSSGPAPDAKPQPPVRMNSTRTDDRNSPPPGRSESTLARVEGEQELVVESLRAIVGRLSRWQSQADLEQGLDELLAGQETLNRESAALGARTLTRPLAGLTPQERADLQKLADRQQRQVEQLRQFERRIDQAAEALAPRDELLADRLRGVRDMARATAARGRMQQAAEALSRNEIGRASSLQQELYRELEGLRDVLENRGISDTETLLAELRRAEDELTELRKEQHELLRKSRAAGEAAKPEQEELAQLRKKQDQLEDETRQLAARLARMRAWQAGDTLRRAARRMGRSTDDNGDPQPDESALTLRRRQEEAQQEALDDLDQARRELAQRRQEVQETLQQEAIEKIAGQLQGLIDRQQNVIKETQRLEVLRAESGNWSRARLKTLRNLATTEDSLQAETAALAEQAAAAAVFALALNSAARSLEQATSLLRERQTGDATVAVQQRAGTRFEQLAEVLKSRSSSDRPPQQPGEGQPQAGGAPPGDGVSPRAELGMFRLLQQELLEQTRAIDATRIDGKLTEARQQELEQVIAQQMELVELARDLMARLNRRGRARSSPETGNTDDGEDRDQDDDSSKSPDRQIPEGLRRRQLQPAEGN